MSSLSPHSDDPVQRTVSRTGKVACHLNSKKPFLRKRDVVGGRRLAAVLATRRVVVAYLVALLVGEAQFFSDAARDVVREIGGRGGEDLLAAAAIVGDHSTR